jgi:hypothetical protein
VHVTDDPERAWATIAPHALHESNSYAAWLQESSTPGPFVAADEVSIRTNPAYRVVTPEACAAMMEDEDIELLVLHPLMGGLPPEHGWASLELFRSAVLPALTTMAAGPASSSP